MTKCTDKLPVIGPGNRTRHIQASRRQDETDQLVLPAIQSRNQDYARPKLDVEELTSATCVRPLPCLSPLANPQRQRETRQITFNNRHSQDHTLTKDPLTTARGIRPSCCLSPLVIPERYRETRQTTRQGTNHKADTSFPLPKIQVGPKPTTEEQTGTINHSGRSPQLEQLEKRLFSEIERLTELNLLQKEDEGYLMHLRKNLADLEQETDRTMRQTMEISSKIDEVCKTLICLRSEMADLQMKQSHMIYNSQRLQDACAKLEAEMAREMSEVMRNLGGYMPNTSTVDAVQNSSTRFVKQRKITGQEFSVPKIRDIGQIQVRTCVPQDKAKVTSKSKSRLHRFASKVLGGKKRSDAEVNTSRTEYPIQFIKQKSQKFIRRFKGRNQISPIPEEN